MTVQIGWRGTTVDVLGNLPAVGEKAPAFILTTDDLDEITLLDFAGQKLVLNIFPLGCPSHRRRGLGLAPLVAGHGPAHQQRLPDHGARHLSVGAVVVECRINTNTRTYSHP